MVSFPLPPCLAGRMMLIALLLPIVSVRLTAETAPENKPVRVGVLTDNYPFSFRGEHGRMEGFAYELVQEIETVMGLRLERVEGGTREINGAFMDGRLDVLQSFAHFPERESQVDFSVPYLTMAGAVFVREGGPAISGFDDLRGRRVLVHKGSLGESLLIKAGMADSVVHIDSVEEALRKLDRGEGDATLATRLTGQAIAHHLGLKKLVVLPGAVPGYDVRYCIAVRKGDSRLLAQMNEGLAVLVRTERFDELYRKWFSHVELAGYSFEQVLLAIAVGLLLALLVALAAAARQRRLHRQIARQSAELRASEERYRGLFEGALDGLVVLETAAGSGEPVVVQTNPAARRLLQSGSGPAPGTRLRQLLAGDSGLGERLAAAVRAREAAEFEHERPGAAGWWSVSVSPLGGRLLVSLRDITEHARARLRLQRQEEHLRHSQKIEAIGTLAGGIAHDFNNLLTSILGNTQLSLLNLPPGHSETGSLEQVFKAARRAQQLVKQILAFSRRSEASWQTVKTGPLVDEVIGFLRAVARGTVVFEHRIEPAAPDIRADPAQVHQVLMNIGTNALHAMRGAPGCLSFVQEPVVVDAEALERPDLKPGRYLRIAVSDTGPGMSREIMDRIFEPFFTTKPVGEGTGLGLSVVHGIMQQHGGTVTVASELGRGTTFHLYFPLSAVNGSAPVVPESVAAVPSGRGQLILLVDDDPAIVGTVGKILQRLGYTVSTHLQADDALAEFEAAPARSSLLLSDLTMPGMNGLQLAARVRAMRPDLPLVLVSGYWGESDLAEARRLRVTDMLHKPLTYEMIGRTVAAHVSRN